MVLVKEYCFTNSGNLCRFPKQIIQIGKSAFLYFNKTIGFLVKFRKGTWSCVWLEVMIA